MTATIFAALSLVSGPEGPPRWEFVLLSHARPALALALAASMTTGGCGIVGKAKGEADAPAGSAPPPAPAPALTEDQVRPVLVRYTARSNRVHKLLDAKGAAGVYAGSSLQVETAKYRIFKANRLRFKPARYGQILGASPKFTGHPKWFFAVMTDNGANPPVRDHIVFVQDQAGGPWRAAYAPLSTKPVKGAIAPGVDVADYPDVVPGSDASLALAPDQVAPALADAINRGSRSGYIRSFTVPAWAKQKRGSLLQDRRTFRAQRWVGKASYSGSRAPAYAVRTTSGGALVWSAIELTESFRRAGGGAGINWRHKDWGDLLRPFTGRSSMKRSITTVERIEMLSYVPPKGRGTIRVIAFRWAPIRVTGS
ncbi:hypothetical protein [Actinomadura sp. WMMA1423]|uniref:hypothetical protein n=1 Tax=Actinomadura sp. WMMA1423 TaxID=2591108 RepID=UPI001146463C|nr:hypothetical protein [Actinomadura sp. WMMA1423]